MDPILITNDNGREFTVRPVFRGEHTSYSSTRIHDNEDPVVEFYDRNYITDDQPLGQFVTSYFAADLADHKPGEYLDLNTEVAAWRIDGSAMRPVIELAQRIRVGESLMNTRFDL